MSHTILLVQADLSPETRTYSDYESLKACMEDLLKIYEGHLRSLHSNPPTITYEITQLFDFIDQLVNLSCLVYQSSTGTYAPHNKQWIKEQIYEQLTQS